MTNLAVTLKQEIRRITRRELKAELSPTRKAVSQHRAEIAALKKENRELKRKVAFLERRERHRLGKPASQSLAKGARFSVRSLKAQRRKSGLSQADYAELVGVSKLTIYNWESGRTKPGGKHLATLVSLRGIGKREAWRRVELLES